MTGSLLSWADDPAAERGLRFLTEAGTWRLHAYQDLAAWTMAGACILRDEGIRPGDVVPVVTGSRPEFVAGFFGALWAGAIPCVVVPPVGLGRSSGYKRHLAALIANVAAKLVFTTPDLAPVLAEKNSLPAHCRITAPSEGDLSSPVRPLGRTGQDEARVLHFTSGSSGRPKGVLLSESGLEANVAAITAMLRMTPEDGTATWLPFHHDMGLIGCLLTPMINQANAWIMKPETFIREPLRWLSCFGSGEACLGASPGFGLAHVVRRVEASELEGFDFASWRALILGAERIRPGDLSEFARLLAPRGFQRATFMPAYGLAEATLAVTAGNLAEEPGTIRLDTTHLRIGAQVDTAQPDSGDASANSVHDSWVVCGQPVAGVQVEIVDLAGTPVPSGVLGEIVVRGPSLAEIVHPAEPGRFGSSGTSPDSGTGPSAGPGLHTGDIGFLVPSGLVVIGRLCDSLKWQGRMIFAEDIENSVEKIAGNGQVSLVALLGVLHDSEICVMLSELPPGPWAQQMARAIRNRTGGLPVIVGSVPRRSILRTSSGKPRRRAMWEAFAADSLAVEVLAGVGADSPRTGPATP